ncbi:prolactin receptor b [Phyllopteryx taeniolatus]|uniref:prolactin receptor b n=1 Tax=Phyllopteryx taeniolatus TaxID=161469 RepID=UPI002AD52B67|nr:prolactin receptor b [Phyllopteryx taeniolatus]XP_061623037.1 prolactin receptor b [Phyllopteryx taeniolatus]
MKRDACVATIIMLLFSSAHCNNRSPPGRPVLLGCRSPEKETFTCWWEPGIDGGLPTTHRLYYQRERLEGRYECPDYHSAGRNACFFDRNYTSIWVDYYLTVVASNALGNATSDILKIDVMDIVKPDAPESIRLAAEDREESPSLYVSWEHPQNVDTNSGWVTLEYQLRARQQQRGGETTTNWKEYKAGTQTQFTLYGVHPGAVFVVQVRCRLDHGSWSSWSHASYVKIPNSIWKEKPFWVSVLALSGFLFLAALCIVVMKRKSVIQCLLPPVPSPKIQGVDFQLLKSGRPEDLISALIIHQDFPPVVAWNDHMDNYLIVLDHDAGVQRSNFSSDFQYKDSKAEQNLKFLKTPPGVNQEDGGSKVSAHKSYMDFGTHVHLETDYSGVKDVTSDVFLLNSMDLQSLELLPEDYSKVVDSKMLLFQKQSIQSDHHKKPPPRHSHGVADLINGGYVHAITTPPLGKPSLTY